MTGAIAKGDEHAFGEFYELWFDRAFAMARAVTRRDESFCLDVVQDCMMRVVKSMRPLRDERAVASWMGKTVFAVAVDRIRQEKRRQQRERVVSDQVSETWRGSQEADERSDWLAARIAELDPADRALLRDRFEAGETLDAVGAKHGISGNAAHGKIYRILERLRRKASELFHE